jgi:outer membrane protein
MKMKSLTVVALLLLFLFCQSFSIAQTPMAFTLKEAQEYAFKYNYDLQNSVIDIKVAQKEVSKNTSIGLPQINAEVDYMDNFALPTTLIPNFFQAPSDTTPQYIGVKFGTRYNLTVAGTLTQLIYSGQYLVGLQTANAYLETVRQKMIKDQMDVRDLVTEAYIGLLIIEESTSILDTTYKSVTQMVNEAKEIYKQGLIEDIDVDQLELNKANLEASLMNIRNQRLLAYNYLKFVMGLKQGEEMTLTDNLDFFINSINVDYLMNEGFDINHNIDYSLLQKQEYLVGMQLKLAKTAYQPSLVGFLNGGTSAYRNSWDFLNTKSLWYANANWGIQLSIPILSSGQRKYAVDQAKLRVEKMKVLDEKTKAGLNLQVETAKSDFSNNYRIFLNNRQGLQTARKIYDKTIEKYRLGVTSSTDLNQKYNQFLQNESNYVQSLYELLKVRIRLAKLLERV